MDPGDLPVDDPLVDGFTGLANRHAMARDLERTLADAGRTGTRVAMLLLDLDGLIRINDEHGHAAGDQVLLTSARRLTEVAAPVGRAYRMGGDEFLVVHEGANDRGHVIAFADEMREAVKAPFPRLDLPVEAARIAGLRVTCTIGIAVSAMGSTVQGLLLRADSAMFHGKGLRPWPEVGDRSVLFDDLPPEERTRLLAVWGERQP